MGNLTKLSSLTALAIVFVFAFSSCNKTIKVKSLVGAWKVSGATFTNTSNTTSTVTFAGTDCFDPGTTTVENSSEYTLNFTGAKVTTESRTEYGTIINVSETEYDLTLDVTINDDGTYSVHVTYEFTDDNGDTQSGDFTTDLNEWYLDENNENNAAVVFHNFPNVLGGFSGGNVSTSDVVLNIEEGDGDEIVFTTAQSEDNTTTDVSEQNGNCVQTSVSHTVGSENRRITFTSAE